jgi:predicted Zn-dependent protease
MAAVHDGNPCDGIPLTGLPVVSTMNRDTLIANLETLIAAGKDSPAVRFGLGKACLEGSDAAASRSHLERAVELDPSYSAAWKLLGKACSQGSDIDGAADAYRRGIAAATAKGDRQAAKEMEVFLRRLERGPRTG